MNDAISAQDFTRAVMNVFDEWGIEYSERHALLGLPKEVRARSMDKFREDVPFPDVDQVMERAAHIMGIDDALHTTYPSNAQMGMHWMRRACRQFRGRQPLAIMLEDGMGGLIKVRSHLDCSFAWDATGSKS